MFSYIHIPFCRQKCTYCKFALTPLFNPLKIETYLQSLTKEIENFFASESVTPLKSIYFGGGTPSVLSVSQIERIIKTFGRQVPFDRNIEITLEANPEDVSPEFAAWIKSIGVNRISLGVQTLNEESLEKIGRSWAQSIYSALSHLSQSGMENINVDFILWLPYVKRWEILNAVKTLHETFSLTHTSVYILEKWLYPEEYKDSISDEEIRLEYLEIREYLLTRGILQYELSNFAEPGFESRHNRSYWDHSNYRWFGLSAASFWNGKRFENSASFAGYYRGEVVGIEELSDSEIQTENLMFGFRTFTLNKNVIAEKQKLQSFMDQGLIEEKDGIIFPTSSWIFILDHIMGELI